MRFRTTRSRQGSDKVQGSMTRETLTTKPNKFFGNIIIFIILIIINIISTY